LFSITFYPFTSYEHNETNLYINWINLFHYAHN
jgi:hypothetical protein